MLPGASCFVVRQPITWETERRYENSSVTFVIALSTNLVLATIIAPMNLDKSMVIELIAQIPSAMFDSLLHELLARTCFYIT